MSFSINFGLKVMKVSLTNHKQLEERIGVPILADVAWQAKHFEPEIDWFALASQNC